RPLSGLPTVLRRLGLRLSPLRVWHCLSPLRVRHHLSPLRVRLGARLRLAGARLGLSRPLPRPGSPAPPPAGSPRPGRWGYPAYYGTSVSIGPGPFGGVFVGSSPW